MTEQDKLQNAINLLMQGRRKEASAELMILEQVITDKNLRIQLIDAALSALDTVNENDKLIKLSAEGVNIAKEYNRKDVQSYFMSRKADFLMGKMTFLQYDQHNLKLSPDWVEFSTEVDKNDYEKLSAEVEKTEKEINALLDEALLLAEQSGDKRAVARVLMANAGIESSRYLHKKAEYMLGNYRTKFWLKFEFMRYPFFERLFIFPNNKGKKLNSIVTSFTVKFLKAAQICEELNDSLAGYAYHNLANDLKSAYRFRKAKKYLLKAKVIAEKYNDNLLKKQVESLEKAINARNRDIPDYINGETRDD